MPKLTINDTDYYTEDFNDTQTKLYNEVMLATDQMKRLEVQFKALEGMTNLLASQIVEAGKDAEDEPEA
jgi:hypothetical protein